MKKLFLLIICILLVSFSVQSQSVATLEAQLSETKDSVQYLRLINDLASAYFKTDLIKSLEKSAEALQLSERLGSKSEKVRALLNYGDCLGKQNKTDEALMQYNKALQLAETINDDNLTATSNQKLGNHYLKMNILILADNHYQKVVDIRKKLNDEKGLAAVYNNLVVLSEQKNDPEGAMKYLKESLSIRRKLGNPVDLSLTLNRMGTFQLKNGQFEAAKTTFNEVITLIDESTDKRAFVNATNLLTTACLETGDFNNAKKWIDKSHQLAEELNDNGYISNARYNEANLYYYIGKYREGVEINSKVIAYLEEQKTPDKMPQLQAAYLQHFNLLGELGLKSTEQWYQKLVETRPNDKMLALIYLNYARYFQRIGDTKQFMAFADKAYTLRDKADKITAALSVAQLGIALQKQQKYNEALPLLTEGKKMLEDVKSNLGKTNILTAISENLAALDKNYAQSIKTAKEALLLAEKNGSLKEQEIAYASLANAYEQSGNKDMALMYYRKKTALRDSLLRIEDYKGVVATNEVLELDSELKKAKSAIDQTSQDLSQEKKSRTNQFLMFLLIGLLSGGIGLYLFYRQKRKAIIDKQNHALALTQSELQLMLEKKRISRDLHDEVGSALSSISILSHSALNDLESQYQKQKIQIIGERAQEAMENIQDIVWACNPDNDTLSKIFQRFVRYSSETLEAQNIEFSFINNLNEQDENNKFSMEQRKDIYLILKELINNLAKHSQATKVLLTVQSSGNTIHCSIKDDGISFDLNDTKYHQSGNGLQNIYARVRSIGAQLDSGRMENNNVVSISIPI